MKCEVGTFRINARLSLPSWERGLKYTVNGSLCLATTVAPFVGAWIEIYQYPSMNALPFVAPFVGAWIEIMYQKDISQRTYVAPFVGAWIEIGICGIMRKTIASLPSWERGLKCSKRWAGNSD